MKKLLLVLSLLLLSSTVFADSLRWDASEGADGYKIYMGETTSSMSEVAWSPNETYDLTNFSLTPGVYYFAVTAYSGAGESGISNIVEYTVLGPPSAPTNLRIININIVIEGQ